MLEDLRQRCKRHMAGIDHIRILYWSKSLVSLRIVGFDHIRKSLARSAIVLGCFLDSTIDNIEV